jgi:formylmethanofuran dehydrogenase subunit E
MGTRYIPGTHSLNGAQSDHDIGRDEHYCDGCDEPTNAEDLTEYEGEELCRPCLFDTAPKHDYQHIPGRGMACTQCGEPWDARRSSPICTKEES